MELVIVAGGLIVVVASMAVGVTPTLRAAVGKLGRRVIMALVETRGPSESELLRRTLEYEREQGARDRQELRRWSQTSRRLIERDHGLPASDPEDDAASAATEPSRGGLGRG